ncbi:MAG: hypothetical protein IJS28_01300 [Synergistaceae bacterium]|nr:hypothetical protein [Synergistaceae bacterium]
MTRPPYFPMMIDMRRGLAASRRTETLIMYDTSEDRTNDQTAIFPDDD